MTMSEKLLVTSALPYANGPIHLGQLAGAYLSADVYVRYQRRKPREVLFVCGTDEHGVPITLAAERKGVSPKAIVDYYHANHKEVFRRMGVSFDIFSRTTLSIHYETAQQFFLRLYHKGLLVEKTTEQLYCPNDQRFLADRYVEGTCPHCHTPGARGDQCETCGKWIEPLELLDPQCMICGSTPVVRQTTHWFLPLGRFQEQIRAWLDSKTQWKENVRNFCYGWLNEGLEDRAVTRDLPWGVPVPLNGYEGKVLYVWFDAPIGYISATKHWAQEIGQPDRWKDYWLDPNTRLIHFIGKDNIVFHAIVWPAMLMGHGDYVLPSEIPANEFLTLKARKISTSRNYAVWLDDYLASFPPDPLRYWLAVNAPEAKDADFSWEDFQARNNSELADILGNFINRTLTFAEKNFDGRVPSRHRLDALDEKMIATLQEAPGKIADGLEHFEVRRAIREFMDVAREANKYFNDQEPWRTLREDRSKCQTTIHISLQVAASLALLMEPFLPFSAERVWKMLNLDRLPDRGDVHRLPWDSAASFQLTDGHPLGKPEILFRKIQDSEIEAQIAKLRRLEEGFAGRGAAPSTKSEETEVSERISIEEFRRVDLRVAKILQAERVEKANKLLKLQVDLAGEQRQIVAGIAEHYPPESLVGRSIVLVANLEPATIRGIESQGMLLAAEDETGKLSLVTLDREIGAGAKVK